MIHFKVMYIHRYSLCFLSFCSLICFFLHTEIERLHIHIHIYMECIWLRYACVVLCLCLCSFFALCGRKLRKVINNVRAYIIEKENYKIVGAAAAAAVAHIFIAKIKWKDRRCIRSRTTRWLREQLFVCSFSLRLRSFVLCCYFFFPYAEQWKNTQILPSLFWLIGIGFVLIIAFILSLFSFASLSFAVCCFCIDQAHISNALPACVCEL